MTHARSRLEPLTISADLAYKRARRAVYDRFPVGAPIDMDELTEPQRQVLVELHAADATVTAYRQDQYATA